MVQKFSMGFSHFHSNPGFDYISRDDSMKLPLAWLCVVAMSHHLFQDEPDEVSPFHDENDEPDPSGEIPQVFQDEPEEAECLTSALFKDEPDEDISKASSAFPSACFRDEPAEISDSGDSACLADDEMGPDAASTRGLVSLSFSTVSQFVATQLCRSNGPDPVEKPKKKRCYDNSKRRAEAEAKQKKAPSKRQTRVPRNDSAPSLAFLFGKIAFAFHPGHTNRRI